MSDRLTRKQKGMLRHAKRKCGLSYRSACSRGIENARLLEKLGLVYLHITNKRLGAYSFRATEKGMNYE